jgi:hypothetical protein
MQFSRRDEFYQGSHITGPGHNFLALELANGSVNPAPDIKALPPSGGCHHAPLNEQQILFHVLEGVAKANERYGTDFVVKCLQYVQNDTGPEAVFGFIALKIIERLADGEEFDSTMYPLNKMSQVNHPAIETP